MNVATPANQAFEAGFEVLFLVASQYEDGKTGGLLLHAGFTLGLSQLRH